MQKYKGWVRYTKIKDKGDQTIGERSLILEPKRKFNTHCAQDQVDEELKDYPNQIYECLKNGKKHFDDDFYIHVLFCKDRLIRDCRKNIFAAQRSCPTPFYDQAVYKYNKRDDNLEFLWVVPDIDICELYKNNIGLVPEDEKDLYENIRKYYSGELARIEYLENKRARKQVFSVTRS